MIRELVHFVQDLFFSGAEYLDGVGGGDRGAVVVVLDYVGRFEDAEEEGLWGK